jgi:hypothetical protein
VTFPGLGGQQPPPQNAAPAGQLTPGIQPGSSQQIVASRVIIIGSGGELLVYSPTAGAGNLIASIAGQAGTDPWGNAVVQGVAAYATVAGVTYAIQIGSETVGSNTFPALFFANQTSPVHQPPLVYGINPSTSGSGIELNSGVSQAGDVASGVIAQDSRASGDPGGYVTIVGGTTEVTGNLEVDGGLLVGGSPDTSTNGLTDGTIAGTSGPQTGGAAAHTHSAGSYAVTNGQHSHTL